MTLRFAPDVLISIPGAPGQTPVIGKCEIAGDPPSDTFTTTGDVEIFGFERDPKTGDETPVKMTRTIIIQN